MIAQENTVVLTLAYGTLTLLMQDDVGGLEVWNIDGKRWEQATPIEGTVVVNIANALQRWSNDQYMSSMHRVMSYGTSEGEEKGLAIPSDTSLARIGT
eukprot:TRINITY_DN6644_c0_g1_i1.p1 TRINITY_DN6644_c0_g1~~TRINITY_DN6644_c0_g1_i1.p1  ORF type:complete len:98 (-),score=11.25 TRINITY_DN6644_c0_g1_i1:67-360(-)